MTTSISVRELDGSARESVDLLLPVLTAAVAHDLVGHAEPVPEFLAAMLAPRANQVTTIFATFDEHGTPSAYLRIGHNVLDNRALAYGNLWSAPDHRGNGFETPLVARLKDWAREHGCDRLVLDSPAAADLGSFAVANGGRLVGTEKRSSLDLRAVDREQYKAWATPSPANQQYRSVRWTSRAPDDLVESFVRARNAMSDAPHGDLELEFPLMTVQEHRDGEASAIERGLVGHNLAAVTPDGEVAGYTQVFAFPGGFRQASIGDTAVVAAHRGHGLGLRLKAENTLWILDHVPHLDVIDTWNNEDNEPMLRVNTLLGYRLADLWQGFQFDL